MGLGSGVVEDVNTESGVGGELDDVEHVLPGEEAGTAAVGGV